MIAVFDVRLIRKFITSNHRLLDEDVDDIIRYLYISGLKEYHRTNFLFRYEDNDIDADIWKNIPVNCLEEDIIFEVFEKFGWIIYQQLEYFIEKSINDDYITNGGYHKVMHINYIDLRGSNVFILFSLE